MNKTIGVYSGGSVPVQDGQQEERESQRPLLTHYQKEWHSISFQQTPEPASQLWHSACSEIVLFIFGMESPILYDRTWHGWVGNYENQLTHVVSCVTLNGVEVLIIRIIYSHTSRRGL